MATRSLVLPGVQLAFLAGCASLLVPAATRIPVGERPNGIVAADLNADGKLDLIVTNGGTSDVSVLLGDGRGRFIAAPSSPLPVSARAHFAAVGDLNRDGHVLPPLKARRLRRFRREERTITVSRSAT